MKQLHAIRVDLVGTVVLAPDKLALESFYKLTVLRRQALQCVGECGCSRDQVAYNGHKELGLGWSGLAWTVLSLLRQAIRI